MLIVSVDTSGRNGSLALARGEADGSCTSLEVVPLEGGTFSAQLIPQIVTLLTAHNSSKSDIAAFAVISGPGSFTGLRVGLSAIKGLAEGLGKPIAAVSLLELVASASSAKGRILAAVDAGRGDIYAGEYDMGNKATMVSERLRTRDEFLLDARGLTVITPDAAIAEVARNQGLQVEEIARPQADALARIGWQKVLSREIVSPDGLEANYIRRSDAEIFSKPLK